MQKLTWFYFSSYETIIQVTHSAVDLRALSALADAHIRIVLITIASFATHDFSIFLIASSLIARVGTIGSFTISFVRACINPRKWVSIITKLSWCYNTSAFQCCVTSLTLRTTTDFWIFHANTIGVVALWAWFTRHARAWRFNSLTSAISITLIEEGIIIISKRNRIFSFEDGSKRQN